jgi:3-deoxy-7-phosphoheptulonate synthase
VTLTVAPALHQTDWPDPDALAAAIAEIEALPGIVSEADSELAVAAMADVALGLRVALMVGDCAQPFRSMADLVVYMESLVLFARAMGVPLEALTGKEVALFLRLAQFFKPRSNKFDDGNVLTFRGAGINDRDPNRRTPDPRRLVTAYHQTAACHQVLRLLNQTGSTVLSSREMLELSWEQALIRDHRNTSGGVIWIGARTNDPDGAHVRLAASLRGAIMVKIGPGTSRAKLQKLIKILNPHRIPGRLTLIFRLGLAHIDELPGLIEVVDETGCPVGLICDPMHGNPLPGKTRDFETMLAEARAFIKIVGLGRFGGLHLEATPDDVRECLGGPHRTTEHGLLLKSDCDPRLGGPETLAFLERLAA